MGIIYLKLNQKKKAKYELDVSYAGYFNVLIKDITLRKNTITFQDIQIANSHEPLK